MNGPTWVLVAAAVLILPGARRRGVPAAAEAGLALVLDLAAAGLRAGQPLASALALAAQAAAPPLAAELSRVAALDRLGAAPDEAWSGLARDGPLGELARVAVRSATSGLKLAAGFERLAADVRADRAAAAGVRAHRAAVLAVGPLAACFLPSFVCLGVIPVVVGVAREVAGTLPGTG